MARRRIEVAATRPAGVPEVAATRPAGVPCCDVCLRETPKAARTEDGLRHCRACYELRFERRVCAECGQPATVSKAAEVVTCRACRDDGRLCIRCGRPAPRAGRVVPGGVACRSCAYHYAPRRRCPGCDRLAPRLSRVAGRGDPVCDHCRRAAECATCARCRRHRRSGGRDEAGRPLCGACVAGANHRCPDCGGDVPGSGLAPCGVCSARRRGRARAAERRGAISPPWAADLFDDFCEEVLLGSSPRGAVVRQVDRAADFFESVARGFATPSEVSASRLVALFGAEALRRAGASAAYLFRRIGLRWDDLPEAASSGEGDLREADAVFDPVARLLADYGRHLSSPRDGRSLSARTRLAYVRAAKRLVAYAATDDRPLPNLSDVRRLLWRTPGCRASLGPFLTWLRSDRDLALPMPRRARRSQKLVEGWLLASAASLLAALEASSSPAAGRALLAACVSRLFALPLERVLKLRASDLRRDGGLSLVVDGLSIELPDRLAVQFDRIARPTVEGLVFAGRFGQRPMSSAGAAHHLRKVAHALRPRRRLIRGTR